MQALEKAWAGRGHTRSVPDPPVRAGDEKNTSSAARWVFRISINISHFQSEFSIFLDNVIFAHTNVLQPRYSTLEILQYFQ